METAVVRQFLDFFKDFLQICQLDNWPNNETTRHELRNAFLMSQHIVKCLNKLHERSIINEFISTLSDSNVSNVMLKTCLHDPPKYILKKIINSSCDMNLMDDGFILFVEMFSEQKLEDCLTDFFIEVASKETLLKNLPTNFALETILKLKVELILSELYISENCIENIKDMLSKDDESMELLVRCLLNNDIQYIDIVNTIASAFVEVLQSKNVKYKSLWKHIFSLESELFIDLCLKYNSLFTLLSKALLDCGKLVKENMSAEYFYIDLTYSELKQASQIICTNEQLKMDFLDLLMANDSELAFWNHIVL